MAFRIKYICSVLLLATVASCGDKKSGKSGDPIVLGDPTTIVTETDSQYLQNYVTDLQLATNKEIEKAKVNAEAATTNNTPSATTEETDLGGGLKISYKNITFFIPGIDTRTYQEQNLEKAYGASFELTKGSLEGNKLIIKGGTIKEVTQRYQTVIAIRDGNGVLALESLRKLTDWTPINGANGVYPIQGLGASNLEYINASSRTIRSAVTRAARNMRLSRNSTANWQELAKKARSPKQPPMEVALRSVMWKIIGQDADGNRFQKQLRIDIPVK